MRIPCVTTVSDAILRHRQSTDGKRISFLSIHFMLTPHYSLNCAYEMPCIRTTNYGYELAVMCELRSVDAKNTEDHSHTHTLDSVDSRSQAFFLHRVRCRLSHSKFHHHRMPSDSRPLFSAFVFAYMCPSVPRHHHRA